jgi:hypothetical protein
MGNGMRRKVMASAILLLMGLMIGTGTASAQTASPMLWHAVTLDFTGPESAESGTPNPFLDYRLTVEFTSPDGRIIPIPGFFAADGNAAETGAAAGKIWRVRIVPDRIGNWSWKASFRAGAQVAVSDDPAAGAPAGFDGAKGSFAVIASDKTGRDFRGKGLLRPTGRHHLQFSGSGEYFLKAGSDAPENMLGYADFDGTSKMGGGDLKTWAPHLKDWKAGDPSWKGGKGKGLIGALNYLAGKGMNAFSFLTLNINGDGKDVWMYTDYAERVRFDCSKLDQWEIVFSHADALGLHMNFKVSETENCNLLDGGDLGVQRKLYFRELLARFGHHLALDWNLGEENVQTIPQVKDMTAWFRDHDPYRHNVVLHTFPDQHARYDALKGGASQLTGASIQTEWNKVYADTRHWVQASDAAGKPWIVANDEQGSANKGVAADADYAGSKGSEADNRDGIRQQTLWGNFMAGGAGVEYYFGYGTGETDLTCQDFRSRDRKWDDARHALDFFSLNGIPFWDMAPLDGIASTGWCLAKPGGHYVVYLPSGGSPALNLTGASGTFLVRWYNPRTGQFQGDPQTVSGGKTVALGAPPAEPGMDWTVWVHPDGPLSVLSPAGPNGGRAGPAGSAWKGSADGRAARAGAARVRGPVISVK